MTTNNDRWTSDHLRQPGGMGIFCGQVRTQTRDMAEEFRALYIEMRSDLESHRREGDNTLKARRNAWRVSRHLRAMEKHARAIMSSATELDAEYLRIYVAATENHGRKALHKAVPANPRELPADLQGSAGAGSAPTVFDLFGGAS